MFTKVVKCFLLSLCMIAPSAFASVVTIDFEEFESPLQEFITDFYAGGTNADGVQGPDYGITMVGPFVFKEPDGNSVASWDAMEQFPTKITVEDGFTDGFAMRFKRPNSVTIVVSLFGLDGSLLLTETIAPDPDIVSYSWETLGLEFDGVAGAVTFSDSVDIWGVITGIDDLTFGSATLVPVPGAVWLFGSGLAFMWSLRRRSAKSG